jgi:hypothetical protein
MKLTLVYAYYDNGDMLERHLIEWASYQPDQKALLEIILVDDGSPNKPATPIVQKHHTGIATRVYRVLVNIPWNQDGARNLAMSRVSTEWAFMTDMDHLVPRNQIGRMLSFPAVRGHYYMPNQYSTDGENLHCSHPNTYLMHAEDFWGMGGYDEDFAGVYGSDGNFRKCCKGSGLREIQTNAFHAVVYRGEDIADARTNEFGRKESKFYRPHHPHAAAKAKGPPYKAINPIRFQYIREL